MVGNPAALSLLMLVFTRLRRAAARFASLAARAGASTPASPRLRPTRPPPPRPARPRQRLPERFAWLVRLVPEAACFGSQLQHLLADPELVALLETAPQAGRILRPLCRLLAVRPVPALLRLPPPARPAARRCRRTWQSSPQKSFDQSSAQYCQPRATVALAAGARPGFVPPARIVAPG